MPFSDRYCDYRTRHSVFTSAALAIRIEHMFLGAAVLGAIIGVFW